MRMLSLAMALLASGPLVHAQPAPTNASAPAPMRMPVPTQSSGFTPLEHSSTARGPLAALVSIEAKGQSRRSVLADIARQAALPYVADRALPALTSPVTLSLHRVPARSAVLRLLEGSSLRAVVSANGQVVIINDNVNDSTKRPQEDTLTAVRSERVSGFVRSLATGEVLRRVTILVDNEAQVRQTNEEGYYALVLSVGPHRLRVRAIGYAPFDTTIQVTTRMQLDLALRTQESVLSAVQITGDRDERPDLDPRSPQMSVIKLDMRIARSVPPVLGEVDPIRTLTLLPGVTTTTDASTAFSVRGGGVDENLILLDESTIYNPSHILGFLSTFNADAIDNIMLYKGAIPSRFGGRLSSVVDVRQRDGNREEFTGAASIGLLSSRGIIEGPLPGSRGSWMLAARRSYADAFLAAASDSSVRNAVAYFYDLNAKAHVRLGETGSFIASGYLGRDNFGQPSQGFGVGWGNRAATLRWNQAWRGRLFSKLTGSWSDYDYRLRFRIFDDESVRWVANIQSADFKLDETWQMTASQKLEFGAEWTRNIFRPGEVFNTGDSSSFLPLKVETRYGVTRAAYVAHDIELGSRFGMQYGFRVADFARLGSATRYEYGPGGPVVYNPRLGRYEPAPLLDSSRVASGDRMSYFSGVEPRASLRLSVADNHSIKLSYARTQQFLQLISNTNSVSPLDVWEPVGPFIKPRVADQYALGWSAQWRGLELSAESYYRSAKNVVDYVDGADVLLNPRLETILLQGIGRSYGLELFARRNVGRLSGWASYTLSRAEQRIRAPGETGGGINNGDWYPTPFDKTHNLALVGLWQWTPKWNVGATFTMASGLPVTLPGARYFIDGLLVPEYGARNAARLPLYHRLDLSATRKLGKGELQFGVLNAYNRFNAQALRVRQRFDNPLQSEAVQTSIFGLVPSINYVFRF